MRNVTWMHAALAVATLAGAWAQEPAAGGVDEAPIIEVRDGVARFEVATNVPTISVHGKSQQLQVRARVRQQPDVITLSDLDATVPVRSLTTGLSLRDDHMRRYIFTTERGETPDLRFTGESVDCPVPPRQAPCTLSGTLSIRGAARPFVMAVKLSRDGGRLRALGDGTVKLSDYGIPLPSQLGVKTCDEVKIHLELAARAPAAAAHAGGGR
jgi:polyisoprenoid-binding protein YceI